MSTKTFLLSIFTAFLVVASLGIASAVALESFTITSLTGIAHNAGSAQFSFTLNNTGVAGDVVLSSSSLNGISSITFPSTTVTIAENSTLLVTGTAYFPAHRTQSTATITADPVGSGGPESATLTINFASSSTISVSNVQSLTKTQDGILNITNTGNTAMNVNLTYSGDFNISLSQTNFALSAGNSQTVTVTALTNLSNLDVGSHSVTITARDLSSTASASQTYTITSDFCEYQNINSSLIEISDIEESSEDPWEWKPLDNVEISVKIENNLDDDEDFVVELGLYDTEEKEFVEIDGEDTLEEEISLDEGKSGRVTFEFEVPIELEDSDGRYVVFVKAYVDGAEDEYCNSYSSVNVPSSDDNDAIKIERDKNDVIVNENEISAPELATAGELVTIKAKVYNIGTEDEDKVKVTLTNTKLGLNLESNSFELDSEDSEEVEFSFVVPQNVENGIYTLKLDTYFDYSSSSDNYKKESDESWEITLKIIGGTNQTLSEGKAASISASLDTEEEVVAGKEINLTVTIKNLNSERATFTISLLGLESWAELKSISNQIITLNAGESKDISIVLKINDDTTAGEHSFTLQTVAGEKVDSKVIAVNVESSSLLSSLFNSIGESKNSLLWVFGIACLIILVVIVILWIRMSRR
ncbi:MAG: putative S-layer protein [Candidatus Pacearchaeota archaeon]